MMEPLLTQQQIVFISAMLAPIVYALIRAAINKFSPRE